MMGFTGVQLLSGRMLWVPSPFQPGYTQAAMNLWLVHWRACVLLHAIQTPWNIHKTPFPLAHSHVPHYSLSFIVAPYRAFDRCHGADWLEDHKACTLDTLECSQTHPCPLLTHECPLYVCPPPPHPAELVLDAMDADALVQFKDQHYTAYEDPYDMAFMCLWHSDLDLLLAACPRLQRLTLNSVMPRCGGELDAFLHNAQVRGLHDWTE